MDTPFCDALRPLIQTPVRFFVPGHKGNPAAIPMFGGALRCDITEIPGADDLSHPGGALAQSQANMTRLYASGATLYSAFGSTSCIQAMLTLFVPPGAPVVMARGCHVSAVRALAFLGLQPHWVPLCGGRPQPQDIRKALQQSGAGAVYITSPDYDGRMADIPAIAEVCRAEGAALLVDNAHGAHLRFLRPDTHPLTLGADACADSAHKTLPCLTPAAMLHLRDASLAKAARAALNLYSSTSPSYPVLYSLDYAAGLLAKGLDFAPAAAGLARAAVAGAAMVQKGDDPLKLCLVPALAGVDAAQLAAELERAGIVPELWDGRRIILMASPYNTESDFDALAACLAKFGAQRAGASFEDADPAPLPEQVCGVRQALFAPRQALDVRLAPGRVMAGLAAPCPPGVPLVLPGELITPELAQLLAQGGILEVDVLE